MTKAASRLSIAAGALLTVAAARPIATPSPAAPPDISGMWQIRLSKAAADDGDAKTDSAAPRLTPAAQAWLDRRRAANSDGYVRNVANMKCLPTGFPELMQWRSPLMIMSGFGRIAIITEHDPGNDEPRVIYMNRAHPEPLDPSWNGDSVGRWEGDTLVVETLGFNGRESTGFAPITPGTRVVERVSLENDGKTLVDRLTLTDPATFVEPYSITWRYDRLPATAERMEAVCEPDLEALAAVDLQKAKAVDIEAARMLDPNARYNADGNSFGTGKPNKP